MCAVAEFTSDDGSSAPKFTRYFLLFSSWHAIRKVATWHCIEGWFGQHDWLAINNTVFVNNNNNFCSSTEKKNRVFSTDGRALIERIAEERGTGLTEIKNIYPLLYNTITNSLQRNGLVMVFPKWWWSVLPSPSFRAFSSFFDSLKETRFHATHGARSDSGFHIWTIWLTERSRILIVGR